jgi:hypothetical protein
MQESFSNNRLLDISIVRNEFRRWRLALGSLPWRMIQGRFPGRESKRRRETVGRFKGDYEFLNVVWPSRRKKRNFARR